MRDEQQESSDELEVLEPGARVAAEIDPRLADVWASVFGASAISEEPEEGLGWHLRMAYLKGYEDALSEETRGQLYLNLGIEPPTPRDVRHQSIRRRRR